MLNIRGMSIGEKSLCKNGFGPCLRLQASYRQQAAGCFLDQHVRSKASVGS